MNEKININDAEEKYLLAKGTYEHYKGRKYFVTGLAVSASYPNEGRVMVLYNALNDPDMGDISWARDFEEFFEEVINPDYPAKENAPYKIPRFKFLGPDKE